LPREHSCSFCGRNFKSGIGMLYVKNDGTILWFCSNKCRVNMLKMNKDPRKLKWTAHYNRSGVSSKA